MTNIRTWRERAAEKRRKLAVQSAIDYLNAEVEDLPGCRKGTAER